MARNESVQRRLQKVRPPRVQLTYDVEIGDAVEQREIPFVAGVIAGFDGQGAADAPPVRLKDRNFVNVDLDSFDEVMKGMAPRASFRVENRLGAGGGAIPVELSFSKLEDFRPESVVRQVEPLRKLLEARARLADLRNKMAGNDRLEELLGELLADSEKLAALGVETGSSG